MQVKITKCIRYADTAKNCCYCEGQCVKNGKANGRQRYICKACRRSFTVSYVYSACKADTSKWIVSLLKEGCGVRSIGRLLSISANTVLRRIISIASSVRKPAVTFGAAYEMDELCTYIQKKTKKIWIAYAIRKDTGEVADFNVGCRTNRTLHKVTETLILANATSIYTDKLPQYRSLIPEAIHISKRYKTNKIERKNLTLRTHLKRLCRKTICFSKSKRLLVACLKIYFWSHLFSRLHAICNAS